MRWFLVFWLFVLSAVSYLDRVNISIAGGSIVDAYHLTDVQLGKVFSALVAGYALFQTIGGHLADRFGPRRVLTAGVLWWGVFTALDRACARQHQWRTGFVRIAVRFLLGAGEAVIYPAANQFIARWIPVRERGIANGWIFAGVGAGAGLTPPLITYFMIHYGWRSSFWVCAIIGFLAGAVWFFAARDNPAEHPRVSAEELAMIQSGLSVANDKPRHRRIVQNTRALEARRAKPRSLGSDDQLFLLRLCGMDLLQLVLSLSRESAWPRSQSQRVLFHAAVSGDAGVLPCWRHGERSPTKRCGPRVGRCILAAVSHGSGRTSSSPSVHKLIVSGLASVVLAGGAGALYFSQSSFWSVTADIAGASAGSVSGFMNMGGQIGGALTGSLTPWIAVRYGWTASFLVAAGLCVVGGLSWLAVDPLKTLTQPRAAETFNQTSAK